MQSFIDDYYALYSLHSDENEYVIFMCKQYQADETSTGTSECQLI